MSSSSSCFHISKLQWVILSQVQVSWFARSFSRARIEGLRKGACEGLLCMHVHEIRTRVVVSVWCSAS